MLDAAPTWTAIAFWAGLSAVTCTAIIASASKRKRALATIQAALERGQTLDASTVRLLLGTQSRAEKEGELRLHAYVWLALGVAFVLWGLIGFQQAHSVFMGIGGVLASIGIALFASARFMEKSPDDDAGK